MWARPASSRNSGKPANSAARPLRTASANSPSKSQKNGNGRSVAHSSHEQQGNGGAQQQHRGGGAQGLAIGEMGQAPAIGMVTDLIMVLDEIDKGGRCQVARWFAARLAAAMGRRLALVGETLGERASDPADRIVGIIVVIAAACAGQRHAQRMMKVVVPLRIVATAAAGVVAEQVGLVAVV